jgi:hypothetical protein
VTERRRRTAKRNGAAKAAPVPPLRNPGALEAIAGFLPALSPADVFRGIVPIHIGGTRYELAALSMEEDEAWVANLDGSMRHLLEGVRAGAEDSAAIVAVLLSATEQLLDAVYAYDRDGVLPDRATVKAKARAIDALNGALTIWVSTNPTLAAALAMGAAATTSGTLRAPTSSSPTPTAGRRASAAGS